VTHGLIDPDLVKVLLLDEATPIDELATQAVATAEYFGPFVVVAQLDTPRPDFREQTEAGGADRLRRVLTVRRRDWKKADPRAVKRPRPGDRVVGHRKRFAVGAPYEGLDLYVESVEDGASGLGSFAQWNVQLTDRAPESGQ